MVSDVILAEHYRYHYSIEHKLKGAMYQIESMKHTLDNMVQNENYPEFLFHINMSLDTFLFFGGSALDILAREVLCYFGITPPSKVFFQTAHNKLMQQNSNDPLIPKLVVPSWKAEFVEYRNTTTHERLVCSGVNLKYDIVGPDIKTTVTVPLPDDPRTSVDARTYKRNPSILKYCEDSFGRILRVINPIYGDIARRAATNGLPL